MLTRLSGVLCAIVLLALASPAASARSTNDRVQFGRSIHVSEGEQAGDVVCIGCSVYVQGSCGDVAVVGGSVLVEGDVRGDVAIVGGSAKFGENATVAGDVAVVGGHILRDPGAAIKGDVSQRGGAYVLPLLFIVPLIPVILIVALIWYLLSRPKRPVSAQPYPGR